MTASDPARNPRAPSPVRSEHLLTFAEAAEMFPEGRRPTVGTILSWVIHGRRKVKLEVTKVNGKRLTSIEAVRRFRDAAGLAIAWLVEFGTVLVD